MHVMTQSNGEVEEVIADDFTEAERAELDADTASNGAPTASAATPAPEPAAAPAPEPEVEEPGPEKSEPDATARALADMATTQQRTVEALAEVAKAVKGEPAPQPEAAPEQPKEPDWDAERKALRGKYDDGQLDDDEYEIEREKLIERKAEWKADQRAAQIVEERLQQDAKAREQASEQALTTQWNAAWGSFSTDTKNADLLSNDGRARFFNGTLQAVADEGKLTTYPEMLAEAAKRMREELGLPEPTAPDPKKQEEAVAKAVKERQAGAAPPDLSRAPQAGGIDERGGEFSSLDNLGADELENVLAHKDEAFIERFLADAPGGLRDNPRG